MKKTIFIILGLLLLSACTSNQEKIIHLENETNTSSEINNKSTDPEINTEVQELPICPTSTATNCRIIQGTTQEEGHGSCTGTGTRELKRAPMNPEDIAMIIPMGAMVGSHVTPIDHMYFQPTNFSSEPDTYNVYADAEGIITSIQREEHFPENKHEKYRLIIMHSCDFYSIYNLLTSLSPEIEEKIGTIEPGESSGVTIPVKEGDILGKIGGQTLDLSLNYDAITLEGFIVPEHYLGESWKIHTVDPFDYFREPIKTELLAKDIRTAEPRGGKIDYDIDGKLVGNWFVEGSGGFPKEYITDSWKNHLSFVYDPIDPSHLIISIGNFSGEPTQSGIKGNSPDPQNVNIDSGIIKYELVNSEYILANTGESWSRIIYANNIQAISGESQKGVILVQMLSQRKIKVESFPNKTASEVSNFINPIIYER